VQSRVRCSLGEGTRDGVWRDAVYSVVTLSLAGSTGCALHGASLFLAWPRKSNQKEGHPCIRVWSLCDQTTLSPALLRGHVTKGRPCPFVPRSASMPRVRLRNACARPPEGEPGPSCLEEAMPALLCFASLDALTNRRLRMPLVGGRVESSCRGVSGMDAAKGLGLPAIKSHGWPLYAGPRSGDGAREVRLRSGRTRMKGRAFFCLLFFARAKKSEAPCKAQPALRAEACATSNTNGRAAPCIVTGPLRICAAITRISPRK